MFAVMAVLVLIVIGPTEGMREFRQHSNGVPAYALVDATPCETGLRTTGYAYVPWGGVMLKQKNPDGTVSAPVCED